MNKNTYLISAIISLLTTSPFFSQNVNPFNGSLEYGVPLLSVPSDVGNAVPINLVYGGNGINVEQPASEVGLGWSLSAGGSIVRNINGIADDFNGVMLNQNSKTYTAQKGTLFGPTSYDVLTSKRNLDSLNFYFPNYDDYNVSGPGIGGSMTPMILNYVGFKRDIIYGGMNFDQSISPAWVTPNFVFNGDFADTLVSRHYPVSPVYSSSPFKMPLDNISGACYNDATPYYGKKNAGSICNENYDPVTHRLSTSNYVEYTIGIHGIESFTITNSAGFIYKYTLPVYSNYSINYTYPLGNNYSLPDYTSNFVPEAKTTHATGSYFVEHGYPGSGGSSSGGTYIVQSKDVNKIAKEWKLTSVTGPDYIDLNKNDICDEEDQGYWISYDYKLWSSNFSSRYPAYGYSYYFGTDSKTENFALSDPYKRSGKFATATLINEEVYYLNSIKTSTHKALFIRDLRMDEIGSNPSYDSGLHDTVKINQSGGAISSWHGNLFDEEGYTGQYHSYPITNYKKTVILGKVDKVTLNFREFATAKTYHGAPVNADRYDTLHIYAGPNETYPEISFTYGSTTYNAPFTSPSSIPGTNIEVTLNNFTDTCLTFKWGKSGLSASSVNANGFNIEWHASGKKMPQLLLKRVLLYDNSYASSPSFPTVTSISNSNNRIDLTGTTNATNPLYNETWYQANITVLKNKSLKGSVLNYDYTLANRYFKNINCEPNYKQTRLTSPNNILQNLVVSSSSTGTGKLTLTKVVATELNGEQVIPSIKFDHNQTISTDNPDYNPIKVDNWGFYKNDASALGYYGYVTTTSKEYTDAWSLRKITSPYGGITEIEYEPNSYSTVSDGKGSYRPISRIFPIASLSTDPNTPLKINLEEGTSLTADLSEVYNASGTGSADVFIPLNQNPGLAGATIGVTLSNFFGTLSYAYSSSTPLPIVPTYITKQADALAEQPFFNSCSSIATNYFTSGQNPVALSNWEYTGNGWVRFQLPAGNIAYGGGNRVRKIIAHNNTDTYTTLYEYTDGVALNEADRFTNPKYIYNSRSNCAVPSKLNASGGDKFEQSPGIGYKKVVIKNVGQTGIAKGWTEMTFNTSGMYEDNTIFGNEDNYVVNVSDKQLYPVTAGLCSRVDTGFVVEYIDKFSPFWGLMKEQKTYDINSNMLSKNVWEYESTQQGAILENFVFSVPRPNPSSGGPIGLCTVFNANNYLYQTCIKRHYPVALKRTTSYGMGTRTITEPLVRDELTGEETTTRISSDNRTSALSFKIPAFRIEPYFDMGSKSVNSGNKNILGAYAYSYLSTDTTLSVAAGSPAINFNSAGASVFSRDVWVRGYDKSTNTYSNQYNNKHNWYCKESFGWVGTKGSIDSYGLYKSAELAANPFNFNTPSLNSAKWRSAGTINLMDSKGHTLESRSFNNKFSATKFDFTGKYVIAQISNCNFKSFTYSGFEFKSELETTDGEIMIPKSSCWIINEIAHTGKSCVKVTRTQDDGPSYAVNYEKDDARNDKGLLLGRIYRASVWTLRETGVGNASLYLKLKGKLTNGNTYYQLVSMNFGDAGSINIGDWQLLSVDIKVPADMDDAILRAFIEVKGPQAAFFDDFQLHPVESSTTSKVYDSVTGRVTAEINSEGFATKYIYDAAGNIIDTYQEIPNVGLKLIKHKTINYARGNND